MHRSRSFVPGLLVSTVLAVVPALSACSSASERTPFDPAGGNGTAVDGTDGTGGTGTTGAGQVGRPGCAGDAYTEELPTTASLAGLSYSKATAGDYLLAALEIRYPLGKRITEGGVARPIRGQPGTCIERFLRDEHKATAKDVLEQAGTVVHECGHFYDLGEAKGSDAAYVVTDDLVFTCSNGDTTTRRGKTFARSLIKNDAFYAKRKACGNQVKAGCDMYADIYLDGSASDSAFQSGDQGFNSVLEEATQYVNSLATALAFEDQRTNTRVTERDGILTFLWYIERYLKMAREEYPEAYATLSGDPCWRQATLSVWDRGWFYLNATEGKQALGIDDAAIEPLVKDPELTAEIDALRKLECQ